MNRVLRYAAGGGAATACAAVSMLFAVPAHACSCALGSAKVALDAGGTVVIVTRTDATPNDANRPGSEPPIGTFRVEDFAGPEPPKILRGPLDTGASCLPYVAPGAAAALSAGRGPDGEWTVSGCGNGYPLGEALQLMDGDPEPAEDGRPVAFVAGNFASGRLAAVDSAGTVVAWDRTPGSATLAAVCPGGETVVAGGRAPRHTPAGADPRTFREGRAELTVHDADGLALRRQVGLDTGPGERVRALRCLDRAGRDIDLVATRNADQGGYDGRLVQVRGTAVSYRPIGDVADAHAVGDGFLVRDGDMRRGATFSRLDAAGRLTPVASLDESVELWKPSTDGRTIAASAYVGGDGRYRVIVLDVETGRQLGETPEGDWVTGLAWTSSSELLVREEAGYRTHPNRVAVYDRSANPQGEWRAVPGEWGGQFDALGETALVYGSGTRLTAYPKSGDPVVADSLRTAAATHVVAAFPDAAFTATDQSPPATTPTPQPIVHTQADDASGISGTALTLAAAGGIGVGLLAVFGWRRRVRG